MKADLISGLLVLAFGGILLTLAIPFGVIEYGSAQNLAMSPSFWPKSLALILTLLGAALVLRKGLAFKKSENEEGESVTEDTTVQKTLPSKIKWRGFAAILALPLYYLSILWLGLIIPSFLAFLFYSFSHSSRRIGSTILWGAIIVGGVTLFFTKGANIVIPMGPIEIFSIR